MVVVPVPSAAATADGAVVVGLVVVEDGEEWRCWLW